MIKKLFLTLTLMVVSMASAFAITGNDLAGKWVSDEIEIQRDNDGSVIKACYSYRFDAKGQMTTSIAVRFETKGADAVSGNIYITAAGYYAINGSTIDINFIPNSVKLDVPLSQIKTKGSTSVYDIQGALNMVGQELLSGMGSGMLLENAKLSGGLLTVKYGTEKVVLHRVKDKKKRK